MMDIMTVSHVKKYFGQGDALVKALDDVSLHVERGEFVAVTGTSGSGKTTLLHVMGGLEEPTEGKVFLEDTDMYGEEEEERTIMRREGIGFVFQSFHLIPALSVYDNIVLPLELDDELADKVWLEELVGELGISEKLSAYPEQLSGGQKQRVAIARALITKPQIVLADEPTGNLDAANRNQVLRLLQETGKKWGQTIVLITHDASVAAKADRVVRLEDGRFI